MLYAVYVIALCAVITTALLVVLLSMPSVPGPQGPVGPAGPIGPPGPQGEAGLGFHPHSPPPPGIPVPPVHSFSVGAAKPAEVEILHRPAETEDWSSLGFWQVGHPDIIEYGSRVSFAVRFADGSIKEGRE
jgi:hypothetical protein